MSVNKGFFSILVLLVAMVACNQTRTAPPSLTPYTESILAGRQTRACSVLTAFPGAISSGDIYIADENPERAVAFSEAFLSLDVFDNVDGSPLSDRLPDFAGETIISVLDFAPVDSNSFRERMVAGMLVGALDSCCNTGAKHFSKLIVVTSPLMTARCRADIDTLVKGVVIYPCTEVLSSLRQAGVESIGVITGCGSVYAGLWDGALTYNPGTSASSADVLRSFLTDIASGGCSSPLERIIVDDTTVDVELLRRSYLDILLSSSAEDVPLRSCLAEGAEFIDIRNEAARMAYRHLRDGSLFTHEISYPVARPLVVPQYPENECLMAADPMSFPEWFDGSVMATAPKTYISYVQNQYIAGRN